MSQRTLSQNIRLFLTGTAMGAADVVPGVSGGTIAFISGVYEELLGSLSSLNPKALRILFKEGIAAFWKYINGTFLVVLFGGIGLSIVSLAKLITWLLVNEPLKLWGFFFGLVVASVWMVGRQVKKWNVPLVVLLVAGAIIAYFLTSLPPLSAEKTYWFLLLSGFIAICAMILPGISGSFILLMLGSYQMIMYSLKNFNVVDILVFGTGCILGLLSFSRVLKWLFKKFEYGTLAVLTGFLVGSLNKIWPWKENLELLYTHSDGRQEFLQANISPSQHADPQMVWVIVCAIIGAVVILGLEWYGQRTKQEA